MQARELLLGCMHDAGAAAPHGWAQACLARANMPHACDADALLYVLVCASVGEGGKATERRRAGHALGGGDWQAAALTSKSWHAGGCDGPVCARGCTVRARACVCYTRYWQQGTVVAAALWRAVLKCQEEALQRWPPCWTAPSPCSPPSPPLNPPSPSRALGLPVPGLPVLSYLVPTHTLFVLTIKH